MPRLACMSYVHAHTVSMYCLTLLSIVTREATTFGLSGFRVWPSVFDTARCSALQMSLTAHNPGGRAK